MTIEQVKPGITVCWRDILNNWRVGTIVELAGYESKNGPVVVVRASNGQVHIPLINLS
jgi:hypothetical protein